MRPTNYLKAIVGRIKRIFLLREKNEKLQECLSVSEFAGDLGRYPSEQGLPYLANVPSGSQYEMEEIVEHNFESFAGSLLCNLYIPKRLVIEHADWIRKILKTHDCGFLVSSLPNGIPLVG